MGAVDSVDLKFKLHRIKQNYKFEREVTMLTLSLVICLLKLGVPNVKIVYNLYDFALAYGVAVYVR